jgi:hypothetical protein
MEQESYRVHLIDLVLCDVLRKAHAWTSHARHGGLCRGHDGRVCVSFTRELSASASTTDGSSQRRALRARDESWARGRGFEDDACGALRHRSRMRCDAMLTGGGDAGGSPDQEAGWRTAASDKGRRDGRCERLSRGQEAVWTMVEQQSRDAQWPEVVERENRDGLLGG